MRRTTYWRAAICVAAIFCGGAVSSTSGLGFMGVGPAEAKAYFTRKRVKGRWITGRFVKKSATKARVGGSGPSARRGAALTEDDGVSARVAALPAPAGPVAAAVAAAPAAQAATAPSLVPLSEDERLRKLREGLQARVSALSTGSAAPQQPPAPEPHSVSLDFLSGMKTTIFSDGTTIAEPFDVAALKVLAATPPRSRAGLP